MQWYMGQKGENMKKLKLTGATSRLSGKKWPVIAGIAITIVLLIVTLITVSVNSIGGKTTTTVTIDGTNVTTYNKASKAEKKVATTVEGIATLEFNTNAEIISVEVTSGSKSWSADSDNILSNIVGLVSDPAIVHSNDMVFTLNANACTDGDTVIVAVKSYSSASKWKKVLDKGVSTTYFAFTAVHKEVETAVEETAEGEGTTVAAPILPSGTMVFDGVTYETYSTEDEALANVIGLPSSITSGCTLTGVPGENTTRMHAWIDYIDEGYLPGLEVFLYSDKNWTESLDLSGLAGRTIVFAFASETGDLIPKVTYEYVAFKLPQHIAE
jgi:hypothetical protein